MKFIEAALLLFLSVAPSVAVDVTFIDSEEFVENEEGGYQIIEDDYDDYFDPDKILLDNNDNVLSYGDYEIEEGRMSISDVDYLEDSEDVDYLEDSEEAEAITPDGDYFFDAEKKKLYREEESREDHANTKNSEYDSAGYLIGSDPLIKDYDDKERGASFDMTRSENFDLYDEGNGIKSFELDKDGVFDDEATPLNDDEEDDGVEKFELDEDGKEVDYFVLDDEDNGEEVDYFVLDDEVNNMMSKIQNVDEYDEDDDDARLFVVTDDYNENDREISSDIMMSRSNNLEDRAPEMEVLDLNYSSDEDGVFDGGVINSNSFDNNEDAKYDSAGYLIGSNPLVDEKDYEDDNNMMSRGQNLGGLENNDNFYQEDDENVENDDLDFILGLEDDNDKDNKDDDAEQIDMISKSDNIGENKEEENDDDDGVDMFMLDKEDNDDNNPCYGVGKESELISDDASNVYQETKHQVHYDEVDSQEEVDDGMMDQLNNNENVVLHNHPDYDEVMNSLENHMKISNDEKDETFHSTFLENHSNEYNNNERVEDFQAGVTVANNKNLDDDEPDDEDDIDDESVSIGDDSGLMNEILSSPQSENATFVANAVAGDDEDDEDNDDGNNADDDETSLFNDDDGLMDQINTRATGGGQKITAGVEELFILNDEDNDDDYTAAEKFVLHDEEYNDTMMVSRSQNNDEDDDEGNNDDDDEISLFNDDDGLMSEINARATDGGQITTSMTNSVDVASRSNDGDNSSGDDDDKGELLFFIFLVTTVLFSILLAGVLWALRSRRKSGRQQDGSRYPTGMIVKNVPHALL